MLKKPLPAPSEETPILPRIPLEIQIVPLAAMIPFGGSA
jgi:hypothetical protein